MERKICLLLKTKADDVAVRFSNGEREFNTNKEVFQVREIVPLSEDTAIVIFDKNSGKRAMAFFYSEKGYWQYFFPTDSHILGMMGLARYKDEIERFNFPINFREDD